jgi:hypothetical protein
MALEEAASVGIYDEDRVIACVKKNGIGGFGTDAMHGEEFFTEFRSRRAEHASEGAGIFRVEEASEGFEFFRLLAEIAGRTNEASETRSGNGQESGNGEKFFAAKIGDGALDICPGSILGEDGSDDDFHARAARPPVLGAVCGEQGFVI